MVTRVIPFAVESLSSIEETEIKCYLERNSLTFPYHHQFQVQPLLDEMDVQLLFPMFCLVQE
jgi:heme-binding NEAT domain protein